MCVGGNAVIFDILFREPVHATHYIFTITFEMAKKEKDISV